MSLTRSQHVAPEATPPSGDLIRRIVASPWFWFCIADVIVSYGILRWARTSPGYDPYGWLDWGYHALRGTMDIKGAPSWKPITFLFTLPYSLLGHLSWWLWRVTALAFAIVGPVVAGHIAYRLVRRDEEPIWPALIAALFAGLGIVMIVQYWHYILSSQSDPMLVSFVLMAIDLLLSRRYRLTLLCLTAAGLGRPEVWALLGLYWLWCWFWVPRMRGWLVAALIVTPFMWFGVPVITGAYWDIAGKLAQHSVRELHSNKLFGTISRYGDLTYWPVLVTAGGTFLWALARRDWKVLGVAAVAIIWMIVEIWFVLSNGFPGVARYMFEAGAATIVLAGIGVGWLARVALGSPAALGPEPGHALERAQLTFPGMLARLERFVPGAGASTAGTGHGSAERRGGAGSGGRSPLALRALAAVIALVMIGFMAPYAKSAWDWEHIDIKSERNRTHSIYMLAKTIDAAGGARFITSCGVPTVDVGTASILAWYTHRNTAQVGYIPKKQIRLGGPVVLFTGLFNGWVLHTYNLKGAQAQRCRSLNNAYYLETAGHPNGEFFHLSH